MYKFLDSCIHETGVYVFVGGIFLDSCVHDIDMLNWLVGEDPVTMYVEGHAAHQMYKDCDDVDTCLVVLKYPGEVFVANSNNALSFFFSTKI